MNFHARNIRFRPRLLKIGIEIECFCEQAGLMDRESFLDRCFRSIFASKKIDRKDRSKKGQSTSEEKKSAGEGTPGSAGMNVAAAAALVRISTCRTWVKDAHERRASFIDGRQVEILKGGTAAAAAALSGPLRKRSIWTFKVENHFGKDVFSKVIFNFERSDRTFPKGAR